MNTNKQIIKYTIVGVTSNGILYALYLILTWLGMGPKTTMSLLYLSSTSLTYFLNRHWTFNAKNPNRKNYFHYLIVYIAGYMINFFALYMLVDTFDHPHQIVQGIMIIVIASFTFLCLKFWVFKNKSCESSNEN